MNTKLDFNAIKDLESQLVAYIDSKLDELAKLFADKGETNKKFKDL